MTIYQYYISTYLCFMSTYLSCTSGHIYKNSKLMLFVNVCELHVIILRFHYVDAVKWRKYTLFRRTINLNQSVLFIYRCGRFKIH